MSSDYTDSAASSFLSPDDDDGRINECVVDMKRALMNEKAAPELLAFDTETVAELSERLKSQQDILDSSTFSASDAVYAALYQMEAERIRYILASYYRVRLSKIKKYAMYLLAEWRTCQELLSAPEQDFLKRYADLKESHFDSTVLAAMPAPFNVMGEPEMVTAPNLAEWVFACVLKDIGDFMPPDAAGSEPITMERGDALIVKYATVKELLKEKAVCLS